MKDLKIEIPIQALTTPEVSCNDQPPCMMQEEEVKVNHSYLLAFTSTLMLASAIQLGTGYTETGQSNFVLSEQLGWEEPGTSAQNSLYV